MKEVSEFNSAALTVAIISSLIIGAPFRELTNQSEAYYPSEGYECDHKKCENQQE